MFSKVPQKTALSALGAVLGVTGASICPMLGPVPTAAASPATAKLDVTMTAGYACPLSCGSPSNTLFTINGVAYSGVTTFKLSSVGRVLSASNGCDIQYEEYGLTQQSGPDKGASFWLTTTSDKICPTTYPNVLIEAASFKVVGGTGAFKGATGKGTLWWSVLAYPQVGNGELLASITY